LDNKVFEQGIFLNYHSLSQRTLINAAM